MKVKYMFLPIICWTLIVIHRVSTESEVNEITKPELDQKSPPPLNNNDNLNEKIGGLKSVVDSKKVDQVNKGKDESKEGVENNDVGEKNSSEQKQVGSKEDQVEKKDQDGSVGKSEKKGKMSEGSELKERTKEKPVPLAKKEGAHGEECDTSNSCKDEKNALVACLRVPGNESPDLSLLIQNKGNGPLSVTISAPDFVQLERTEVQLQEKEDKKVKVSIKEGGTDSLIILTGGNGNCSIDFRDHISSNFRKETNPSANSRDINTAIGLAVLFLLGVTVFALSIWRLVRFVRIHYPPYQKVAMELPVSGDQKKESDLNDGWNNNWDDDWDDEEAPKTPSMPVTPSLSSKGLASRRFNKEGWKD